jgi:transcription elongation factor GreB
MSRGFVKEDDLELAGTDLPERPVSDLPNYVTPQGLQQLKQAATTLDAERTQLQARKEEAAAQQRLSIIDRDLRYIAARLENAILVDTAKQPKETVLFGAKVAVEDDEGVAHTFYLVGEDEAEISEGKVSWASPLAKALIGHKVGETVVWRRPAGNLNLEITDIQY